MTFNPSFRVRVHADITAARVALSQLERQFRDLNINVKFGGDNRQLQRVATSVVELDKALTRLTRNTARNENALRSLSGIFDRLDKEVSSADRELRDTAGTMRTLSGGIRGVITPLLQLDQRLEALGSESDRPLNRLVTVLRTVRGELERDQAELRDTAQNMDLLVRSISRLISQFKRVEGTQVDAFFRSIADGIHRLSVAMRSADQRTGSFAAEMRDLADAFRAVNSAMAAQLRMTHSVGPRGRAAARSQGSPIGFIGAGAGPAFFGVGGVGAQFASAAVATGLLFRLGNEMIRVTRLAAGFTVQTARLAAQFDFLIRRADVLAGGGGIAAFTEIALAEGARTIFTANEAAKALGLLAQAGFNTEEAMAALPGVLDAAAADQLSLAEATLITARTLRGFNLDASDSGRVADVLAQTAADSATSIEELGLGIRFVAPVASQLGISLEEIAASMGVLGDNAVIAGLAGRALRRALQALLAPTAVQSAAFERLNVDVVDIDGNFIGLIPTLRQLRRAQQELNSDAAFTGEIFRAFGVIAGPRVLTLIQNLEEVVKRTEENFLSFGRAAEIANQQLSGLEGAMERLRGEFESGRIASALRTGLTRELTSVFGEVEAALTGVFANVVDPLFEDIAVALRRFQNEILPVIQSALAPAGEIITDIVSAITDFLADNAVEIKDALLGIGVAIRGITDAFIGLGEVAAAVFGPLGALLAAIPREISSALSSGIFGSILGGGAGVLIGGIIGAAGSGAAAGAVAGGLPGAIIGGLAAAIAGAVGAALSESSSIEERAAQFGVDLSNAINEGFERGLNFKRAINDAIRDLTTFQNVFQVLNEPRAITAQIAEIESIIEIAERRNELLERSTFTRLTTSQQNELNTLRDQLRDFGLDIEEDSKQQIRDLRTEVGALEIALAEADATKEALFDDPFISSTVTQSIQATRGLIDRLLQAGGKPVRERDVFGGIFGSQAGGLFPGGGRGGIVEDAVQFINDAGETLVVTVEENEERILNAALQGSDAPALLVNGMRVTAGDFAELIDFVTAQQNASAQRLLDALDETRLKIVEGIAAFTSSLSATSFGENIFTLPENVLFRDQLQAQMTDLLNVDWAAVLNPERDEEGVIPWEEIIVLPDDVTIEELREGLKRAIEAIPEGLREETAAKVEAALSDEGQTVGDRALLAAWFIDQASQEAAAQQFVDANQAIVDRIAQLTRRREQTATERAAAIEEEFQFIPESIRSIEVTADQIASITEPFDRVIERLDAALDTISSLAGEGQTFLAAMAAGNREVLTAIQDSEASLETLNEEIGLISGEAGVLLGLNTTPAIERLRAQQAAGDFDVEGELTINANETQIADVMNSSSQDALDGFTGEGSPLSNLPETLGGLGIDAIAEFDAGLGNSSPSFKTEESARNLVLGLINGWVATFPVFRAVVLSNFATLILSIESMFRNLTFDLPTPVVPAPVTPPSNAFHTGGFLPGRGEGMFLGLGGEFVLQRSAVAGLKTLGIDPTILNRDPQLALSTSTVSHRDTYDNRNLTHEHHYHFEGSPSDMNPRRMARAAQKEFSKAAMRGFK